MLKHYWKTIFTAVGIFVLSTIPGNTQALPECTRHGQAGAWFASGYAVGWEVGRSLDSRHQILVDDTSVYLWDKRTMRSRDNLSKVSRARTSLAIYADGVLVAKNNRNLLSSGRRSAVVTAFARAKVGTLEATAANGRKQKFKFSLRGFPRALGIARKHSNDLKQARKAKKCRDRVAAR